MADWTENEVDIILKDYFDMLIDELNGERINKAAHNRQLQRQLRARTEGSIEYKHQNISAALFKLNQPWIDGYKPAFNYQSLLDSKVADYLAAHPDLIELFKGVATKPITAPVKVDFRTFETPRPQRVELPDVVEDPGAGTRRVVKLDYFEIERLNRSLGLTGEEMVMEFERWRLIKARKESLIKGIEWISRDQGDGLGYDIRSKNVDGTDRFIEVKTTKQGKNTPIFFSRNEYEFASENRRQFYLYRVYDLKKVPKMFIATGRFEEFCRIRPISYQGSFV